MEKVERTLAIIKPDGVARGLIGKVISRIEKEHLKIIALLMTVINKEKARCFYKTHESKAFFDPLVEFTSSGPIVVMILEGLDAVNRWRNLMGVTNSAEAAKGTIRGDFGDLNVIRHNIVHGSDSIGNAEAEINYFFRRR